VAKETENFIPRLEIEQIVTHCDCLRGYKSSKLRMKSPSIIFNTPNKTGANISIDMARQIELKGKNTIRLYWSIDIVDFCGQLCKKKCQVQTNCSQKYKTQWKKQQTK
jgi:hypothetical protein